MEVTTRNMLRLTPPLGPGETAKRAVFQVVKLKGV